MLEIIATEFARHNPAIAAALGLTVDELARLASTSVPLKGAVERGWIRAEEQRFLEGEATLDDLRTLGYSHDESLALLVEQGGARASST